MGARPAALFRAPVTALLDHATPLPAVVRVTIIMVMIVIAAIMRPGGGRGCPADKGGGRQRGGEEKAHRTLLMSVDEADRAKPPALNDR